MEEPKITVAETQLKARRTSLGKKTNEELINIILRKDKTERNNSAKIQILTDANFDYARRIDSFEADMAGMQDKVKTNQETIDNLQSIIRDREETIFITDNEIARLKNKCNILRKAFWTMTCIALILVVIFII